MLEKYLPYLGGLGIIIGSILAWMSAGRKSGVDESGLVFAQWKTLMESHKEDMRILKEEFTEYKRATQKQTEARNEEMEGLRRRLSDVENNFAKFRKESDERNRLLDEENRGLRREITQVSRSSHAEIAKVATQIDATDAHMEEVEPEARKVAAGFEERLRHIDNIGHNNPPKDEGDK